jgi:hypothetical protein
LVPPRDAKALADAVVRLLQDRTLRHWMGANSKRKINSECSAQTVAEKTVAVYRAALGRAQLGTSGASQT